MIDEAGRAAHPVHHRHPGRHRRDAARARGEPARDPRAPPRARPHPGGDRAELPRRRRACRMADAPEPDDDEVAARRGAGAARSSIPRSACRRRPTSTPRPRALLLARGHQRFRRHLAGDARLHQPAATPGRTSTALARRLRSTRASRCARGCRSTSASRAPGLPRLQRCSAAVRARCRRGSPRRALAERRRRAPLCSQVAAMNREARLGALLDDIDAPTCARILDRCLEGRELGWRRARSAVRASTGASSTRSAWPPTSCAREQAGDVVSYVVNRNINFTNVCVKACRFCAFSRTQRSEEGYFLDAEEIVRRALEARALGATEVCIQAGLAPGHGRPLLRRALPRAQAGGARSAPARLLARGGEVRRRLAGRPDRELPRGAARRRGSARCPAPPPRCSTTRVRDRIAPGRITTAEWIEVVRTRARARPAARPRR